MYILLTHPYTVSYNLITNKLYIYIYIYIYVCVYIPHNYVYFINTPIYNIINLITNTLINND